MADVVSVYRRRYPFTRLRGGALAAHPACRILALACAAALAGSCALHGAETTPQRARPDDRTRDAVTPATVPGTAWRAGPALGHAADAVRRNLRPGQHLSFHDLEVRVTANSAEYASSGDAVDIVHLLLSRRGDHAEIALREGSAVLWNGYRIAAVAVYGPGQLGAGLNALEIATLASLPPQLAASAAAGGADMRLRIPHSITRITLHHTGSAQPLRPEDDPVRILRNLQSWGARDRNWWDVPYHYLIDLDGTIYEGRDWRYTGETNTEYDPAGHFLISVIGNYEMQQPTAAQIDAIADMMAWAMAEFSLDGDVIGGHYHFAGTSCPGRHLRRYLEDGTLRRMAESRLAS